MEMLMHSTTRRHASLPWPDGFGRPPHRLMIGVAVFFAFGTVIFALKLRDGIAAGSRASVMIGAAGVIVGIAFFILCISLSRIHRSVIPIRATVDGASSQHPGLKLPADRRISAIILAWFAAGCIFLAAYAAFFASSDSASPAVAARNYIIAALLGIAAVGSLWATTVLLRAQLSGERYLRIDEKGVTLDNGSLYQIIEWKDIADVTAEAKPRFPTVVIRPKLDNTLRTLRTSSLMALPGNKRLLREMVFGPQAFKIDPALLYYAVRFYWQHPEARIELTTDAVIDRIQSGEIV